MLATVILAAGQSSRMGRPKMLLPWGETTVLGHLIALWSRVPAEQIAVVCAPDNSGIAAELDRLKFPVANRIVNPEPTRGMFSSIQCAAQWHGWNSSITHWAISLGDQPHLKLETLIALADFASQHPEKICQPSYGGHARHPVILPEKYFKKVAESKRSNLKEILQQWGEPALLKVDDQGLAMDLDTLEDYEAALKVTGQKWPQ